MVRYLESYPISGLGDVGSLMNFGKYDLANFKVATSVMYAVGRRVVRKSGTISRRPAARP
jgi:hypothetical protein